MGNLAVWQAVLLLVAAFYFLARSSSWLVDGAVGIAERLRLPKLLIGIVLVGFATTAPEFAVSIISALSGNPEMALGNAVGSVIVDDGVALALVGLLAVTPVVVPRRMLLQTAAFLVVIDVVAFILVITNRAGSNFVLTRWGGGVLLGLFFVYLVYIIWDRVRRPAEHPAKGLEHKEAAEKAETQPLWKLVGLFVVGLVVVIGASHVVVKCAVVIATAAHIPEAVVALTIVAIGTSLPEIATCIAATRKGHGALAVGDIIGADVLNIAWIAGASAVANPLVVEQRVIYFMFPAMLVIVFTTLGGLIICRRMTRALGIILIAQYAVYLAIMLAMFVFKI
ncbi:MAG: sodium:calcium antiporter [Planctomycetota bacterium]|jgi:cation:H+ antiporter